MGMKPKVWTGVALATVAVLVGCQGKKDLNEEIDDVVKAQEEAAKQVQKTPSDTAEIRRKAEKVIEEQRDVQKVLPESVAKQHIPRIIPSTTSQ
jgi:uncharacterized protein YoxC